MRVPIPTPRAVLAALAPGNRDRRRTLPISDRSPDPGLFGPGSMTWRVMREPLLILGGGRALLLQAAHPLVAQGAIDHSTYATDPFGRLHRTLTWVTAVTFGTTREARAASRVVNRQHAAVAGTLPLGAATERVPSGAAYTGRDPELLRWVHATFVDTMLTTHDAFVGGLDEADRDTFVREWHVVGRLMGVPVRLLPTSAADLRAYVAETVGSGAAHPGAGSRRVADTVLRPPLPPALRAGFDAVAFATVGLLPAELRRGYGITWTPAHALAHAGLRIALRGTRRMPGPLRSSPVADFAERRARGELSKSDERPAVSRSAPARSAARDAAAAAAGSGRAPAATAAARSRRAS